MITNNVHSQRLVGLSSDAKQGQTFILPTDVPNGTVFECIDKDERYIFDEDSKQWHDYHGTISL